MITFKSYMKKVQERRLRRIRRLKKKIIGTQDRPRLSIFRSNKHFHVQIIDDTSSRTIASASTISKDLKDKPKNCGNIKAAELVGVLIAQRAKQAGITQVVLDRGWYRYHGRVESFADAARKGGLKF